MNQLVAKNEVRNGLEGSTLGEYRVGARLGSGGAAAVYFGVRDAPDSEVVAIKVIHDHLAEEREFVQMFHDEARVALQLAHLNIVRTYSLGQEGDRLFLTMEYLDGQSMHDVFVCGTRNGARLPLDLVAWIGAGVARALHYAHTLEDPNGKPLQLVHRDVSPRNIFITFDGVPKLIDFGIAHAVGRVAKTAVGQMKGTFSYIAPERALGGSCDHRADVFSLAVTLFEAGTGRRLFKGDDDVQTLRNILSGKVPDPREVRPGFPEPLAKILLRALSTRPDRRFPDAASFADALESFVTACGREDPQQRLANLMQSLFRDERAAKRRALEAVRSQLAPATPSPPEVSRLTTGKSGIRSIPPRKRRAVARSSSIIAAVLTVAAVVLLSRPFGAHLQPSTPVAAVESEGQVATLSSPPAVTVVTIEVETIPSTDSTFDFEGETRTGAQATFESPRDDSPRTLVVRAEGYVETKLEVVPNGDKKLSVVLQRDDTARVAGLARTASSEGGHAKSTAKAEPTALSELLNKRH